MILLLVNVHEISSLDLINVLPLKLISIVYRISYFICFSEHEGLYGTMIFGFTIFPLMHNSNIIFILQLLSI